MSGFDPFHYAQLSRIESSIRRLTIITLREDIRIMAAIDDLNAVVAELVTDVGTALQELKDAQAGDNDAAIQAAVAKLTDIHTQLISATVAPNPAA